MLTMIKNGINWSFPLGLWIGLSIGAVIVAGVCVSIHPAKETTIPLVIDNYEIKLDNNGYIIWPGSITWEEETKHAP